MSRRKAAQSSGPGEAAHANTGSDSISGQEQGGDAGGTLRSASEQRSAATGDERDTELRYRQMFENTSEVVVISEVTEDGRFRVLDCNPAWEKMSGLSRAALVGKFLDEGAEQTSNFQEMLGWCRECLRTGNPSEFEQEFETPEGRRWFRSALIPVRDDSGRIYRLLAMGRDITEQHRAQADRQAHLRFFESTDRVNSVLQGTNDLEQALTDLLDLLLSLFSCDRSFLVYPCDPDAPSSHVVMERTAPEYPSLFPRGREMPTVGPYADNYRLLLQADGPVTYGPGMDIESPPDVRDTIGFLTGIGMAVYPRGDRPYMFGLHQCSHERPWTEEDKTLFEAIGRRLGDALTGLLAYRNVRESEERLQAILVNSPDVIASQDESLRYTWISNPSSPLSSAEAVGKTDEDLLPPAEARYLTAIKHQVLTTGNSFHEELPSHLLGEMHWYDTFIEPMRDDNGSIIGVGYYARDITRRKQAEEALRHSEERYRAIFQNAPLGIFRSTPEGRFLEVNPALAALLRYDSPEEVVREIHSIAEQVYIHPEDRERVHAVHEDTTEFVRHQEHFWRKDGTQFIANLYLKKVPDSEGNPIYFEGIVEDITDRVLAEEKLVEASQYTRSLIDASPDHFATVGPDGMITDANRATEKAIGLPRERLVGSHFAGYFTDPERAVAGFERVLEEGFVRDFDLTIRSESGETANVRFNATTHLGPSGEVQGVLAVAHDLTPLEEAESQTRRALRQMVEAIALTIEMRDPATAGHQRRVCELATAMAEHMGLDAVQIEGISLGASIHDIGKLHIPVEVLGKSEPLSQGEWQIIREHPAAGAAIVHGVSSPWPIEQMMLQHHERLDGSGYPEGLRDQEILLESRILAVADVVDAMNTPRPDRSASGVDIALAEIERGSGVLFDERAVAACVNLFREHHFEFHRETPLGGPRDATSALPG
jgi:PAS domain S-box-containing protein